MEIQPVLQAPLTVTQLTSFIKQHLESKFQQIFLQGEISNFTKQASSGHLYFTIKDSNAQIGAIMFRSNAIHLSPQPKAGDHIIVKGEISVYPPQGTYKIIVRELYYVGLGALLLKFEQLKLKLMQQGWFAPERKKPIPSYPKTIGIVTSPTGAVIQDVLNILNKRFPGFHLILNPVRVQGEGAAEEIASAIQFFNKSGLVDVIIVARGGGSLEDLWPFNEEIVAAAIFFSDIPVISAVGHETDYSLSDFVADVRAPTPTAAAQMVIPEKSALFDKLSQSKRRMQQTLQQQIRHHSHRVNGLIRHPIFSSPMALLNGYIQQLDQITQQIDHSQKNYFNKKRLLITALAHQAKGLRPETQLYHIRQRLDRLDQSLTLSLFKHIEVWKRHKKNLEERLADCWKAKRRLFFNQYDQTFFIKKLISSWNQIQQSRRDRLQNLIERLHSVDPRTLLQKGYSILFSEMDHSLIISCKDLKKNQNLKAYFSDGTALLTVKEVSCREIPDAMKN